MPLQVRSPARGRMRPAALALTVAGLMLGNVAPALAGWVYTPIVDFNLTETAVTYGSYNTSTGSTDIRYRWVDDPDHTTVIAANDCSNGALYGPTAEIPAHNTSYHVIGASGAGGYCFNLRGRVAIGAGSMVNHDGNLGR